MVFVRNALVSYQDEQLISRAESNVGAGFIDVELDAAGEPRIRLSDSAEASGYYVAIYEPATGRLLTVAPKERGPIWPESFSLAKWYEQGTTPFELYDEEGHTYRASAGTLDLDLGGQLYPQLVALPMEPIDRNVATFFGIFTIFALVTILAGALTTRWLVTRTFRPLGQVESAAMAISSGDFGQRLTPGDPATEVGKLTLALNTMLDRLDASLAQRDATVRQMRRFIGDASHELRTPLVTVRGYAELYRMGAIDGDENTAQAMERIEKEAIRMGGMVEDLLALARLDERRDVDIAPLDLRPIARDAAMDVRAAAPQRTVTVVDHTALAPLRLRTTASPGGTESDDPDDTRTGERRAVGRGSRRRPAAPPTGLAATFSRLRRTPRAGVSGQTGEVAPLTGAIALPHDDVGPAMPIPPIVLGEENRVRQIVANLLGNARRFTPDDSPIEISIGTDPSRISENAPRGMGWIAVSDHGEGIPEQIRTQIFERFWRADSSRTRETGGTGLGLAIVASVVDALHGSVVVEDTPGGGATFRVWLPIAAEATLYLDTQPLPELGPRR